MKRIVPSFLVALFGCVLVSRVYAQEAVYRGTLAVKNPKAFTALKRPADLGSRFSPIRMELSGVKGLPRLTFVFNRRKMPSAASEFVVGEQRHRDDVVPVLLQGTVKSRGRTFRRRVAASIIGKKLSIVFARERNVLTPRIFTLTGVLAGRAHMNVRVSRLASSALAGKACDNDAVKRAASSIDSPRALALESVRVVTISTDADYEWYQKYGVNSNAEISAILNAAEAVYELELGIRFALVKMHTYVDSSSPYSSTNASTLLRSFATNPDNARNLALRPESFHQDVDVKYLFSGKNLDGTTVGLAYIGAACWSPKQAYGLVQNVRRDYNVTTFMHELGHTLGAGHDDSDRSGIMYPSLGVKTSFSELSKHQISRHLAGFGKCIEEKTIAPNLHNADLSLQVKIKKSVRVVAELRSNTGSLLSGTSIVFTFNKRRVTKYTNAKGRAILRINRKKIGRRKSAIVRASTLDGEVETRAVKLRLS
jgi:hypothetical protein